MLCGSAKAPVIAEVLQLSCKYDGSNTIKAKHFIAGTVGLTIATSCEQACNRSPISSVKASGGLKGLRGLSMGAESRPCWASRREYVRQIQVAREWYIFFLGRKIVCSLWPRKIKRILVCDPVAWWESLQLL